MASTPDNIVVKVDFDLGVKVTEVQRLTIKPGDALCIRLTRTPTAYDYDYIPERVRAILDLDWLPVLIFGPDEDISLLGPPQ
jgi:hypothetical protein